MLAHSDGRLCLGSMLLQPLGHEFLYIGLARSNVFATLLLGELGKVKKQRQAAMHNKARVTMRLQPFQIALNLRANQLPRTLSMVEGLT